VNSKFDDFKKSGYKKGFNASEQRGWTLFSETFGCIECHALPHFTNYALTRNFNVTSSSDLGRFRITGKEIDKWKFKTPSLRNIDLTGPYMHDGSIKTLEDVILRYAEIADSIPINRMKKFTAKRNDVRDLIAFLKTLTDKRYTSKLT
jgi:cytochrome c peroxidase